MRSRSSRACLTGLMGLAVLVGAVACGSSAGPSRTAWCPKFGAFRIGQANASASSPNTYAARAIAARWGSAILRLCPDVVSDGVGSGSSLFIGVTSRRGLPRRPVSLYGVPVSFQVIPPIPARSTSGKRPMSVPRNGWTNPYVTPSAGGAHTVFTVSLTVRAPVGHQGALWRYYDLIVGPRSGNDTACRRVEDFSVAGGRAGQVVRVALPPPARGWCSGNYKASVALDGEPYCLWKRLQCGSGYSILPFPGGDASFTVR